MGEGHEKYHLVPKIDRQGIEFPRIPCKVVRMLENGYYEFFLLIS